MSTAIKKQIRSRLVANYPYQKYHNFLEFCDHKPNRYCGNCNGSGRITYDDSDPIEGHKMSTFYDCIPCNKTGLASSDVIEMRWRIYRKKSKAEIKKYEKRVHLVEMALIKLKLSELEALSDFI